MLSKAIPRILKPHARLSRESRLCAAALAACTSYRTHPCRGSLPYRSWAPYISLTLLAACLLFPPALPSISTTNPVHSGYTRGKQQSSEQDLENQNDDQLSALGAKISALRGVGRFNPPS